MTTDKNNKADLLVFDSAQYRYPFVQQNTVVSHEFLNSINRLLGPNYDTELLLRYYHDFRLMYPKKALIGNAYVYYKKNYTGIDKNPVKSRDLEFERDFNAVFNAWWKMSPIDFLRQYESIHRAPIDDSGFENGLVLQSFLSDVLRNHPDGSDEVNVVIINPTASFVAALSDMLIPEHIKFNCYCLDEHIVGIYRSASELEKFQWSHTNELQILESADQILFFVTTCPEESVTTILQDLSALSDRSSNCTVKMVVPSSYMKSKKSFNIRSLVLDNFSVHHVLVVSRKATNVNPKISEFLLPLPENSQKNSTDLNKYGGDLFGAHLDYSLRTVGSATADELAYLSGNKLVTTVGTHYCDYLHAGRQLVLHRKLDRITDYNRRETEAFSPRVQSFVIENPKEKLTIKTSAHRSTVSVEIDLLEDSNFVELVADCELRYGMDITANYFSD